MRRLIVRSGATVVLLAWATNSWAQPLPLPELRWDVTPYQGIRVDDDRPGAYRIYDEPMERLVLSFNFFNDSDTTLLMTPAFIRGVVVRIEGLPLPLEWDTFIRGSGRNVPQAVKLEDTIQLEPRTGIDWQATAERADRQPFDGGNYRTEVSIPASTATLLRGPDGPWPGRAVRATKLMTVTVAAPQTTSEQVLMYRSRGVKALIENRITEALTALQDASRLDPTDSSSAAWLGNAYLRLRQYREAVAAFEQSWRLSGAAPPLLPFAYVGIGDEGSALRILRLQGVSETRISNELQRMRAAVRTR